MTPLDHVAPLVESGFDNVFDIGRVRKGVYIERPALFSEYAIHVHDRPDDVMRDDSERWIDYLDSVRKRYCFMGRVFFESASSGRLLFI